MSKETTETTEVTITLNEIGIPVWRDADGKLIPNIPKALFRPNENEVLAKAIAEEKCTRKDALKAWTEYSLATEKEIYLPRWEAKVEESKAYILETEQRIAEWDSEPAELSEEEKLARKTEKLVAALKKAQAELAKLKGVEI